ncbi:MAG: HAMP domain-containing protein [Acidimicrobiales bacterium]
MASDLQASVADFVASDSAGRCGIWKATVPLIFCSNQLLHTDGTGPSTGTLTMFSPIDEVILDQLSSTIGFDVKLSAGRLPAVSEINGSTMRVAARLRTVNSPAGAWLITTSDRPVNRQAGATRSALAVALVVSMLALIAVVVLVVDRFVLARLRRTERTVTHIGSSGDLSTRVDDRSGDEIGRLARSLDAMLDVLADREADLRRREDDARSELVAASTASDEARAELDEARATQATVSRMLADAGSEVIRHLDAVGAGAGAVAESATVIGGLAQGTAEVTSDAAAVVAGWPRLRLRSCGSRRGRSVRSRSSSPASPRRRTCSRSTPRSSRRGPARAARGSRWWRAR